MRVAPKASNSSMRPLPASAQGCEVYDANTTEQLECKLGCAEQDGEAYAVVCCDDAVAGMRPNGCSNRYAGLQCWTRLLLAATPDALMQSSLP